MERALGALFMNLAASIGIFTDPSPKTLERYAVAVHDGDIGSSLAPIITPSSVPEPATYAQLMAGLALVGALARRRKAS